MQARIAAAGRGWTARRLPRPAIVRQISPVARSGEVGPQWPAVSPALVIDSRPANRGSGEISARRRAPQVGTSPVATAAPNPPPFARAARRPRAQHAPDQPDSAPDHGAIGPPPGTDPPRWPGPTRWRDRSAGSRRSRRDRPTEQRSRPHAARRALTGTSSSDRATPARFAEPCVSGALRLRPQPSAGPLARSGVPLPTPPIGAVPRDELRLPGGPRSVPTRARQAREPAQSAGRAIAACRVQPWLAVSRRRFPADRRSAKAPPPTRPLPRSRLDPTIRTADPPVPAPHAGGPLWTAMEATVSEQPIRMGRRERADRSTRPRRRALR